MKILYLVFTMLVLSFGNFANAATSILPKIKLDSTKPIDIQSDSLTVRMEQNIVIFKGGVSAEQDKIKLSADQMDVHYHANKQKKVSIGGGRLSKIDTKGSVLLQMPGSEARAKKGRYDVDNGKIFLVGDVTLMQDKNILTGDKFLYDTKTGETQMLSSGKVRLNSALLLPEQGGAFLKDRVKLSRFFEANPIMFKPQLR